MPTRSQLWSRKSQFAALLGFFAIFIAFSAFYKTSSQGDMSETYPKGFRGGACTIETEALTIGYSGYYLPEGNEAPKDTIRSAYVPIQCGKVPEPATVNISIDLLYPETARDFILGQRLVKVEILENEREKEIEILSIPAQRHSSGVITQAFKLSEPGQYMLYLDGNDDQNSIIQLKVPLKVGLDWNDYFRKLFSTFLRKE